MTQPYSAAMTADPTALDRIFERLLRTLSAGGPDQLRSPFTVAEIVQSLVPYRTYRSELGVDTLQDYEHAVLEMLAGERGWLVCDPDTVTVIKKELASPDPDTGLLRRLQTVEVRVGAIRMPVLHDVRSPIAREDEDAADESVKRKAATQMVSDAVAIGAVMDAEDAERATSASTESVSAERAEATPVRVSTSDAETVLPPLAGLPMLTQVTQDPASPTALHAMQGVTSANPRTLSHITSLSVPSVYGDPIDFRGVRHAPVDIGGVIFLFGMVARELGFNVEAISSGYPRCEAKRQIAPGKWARVRIEFELESRNFRDAGRNPGACDLIVCWRDTWTDRPASLDVLSISRVLPTLVRE